MTQDERIYAAWRRYRAAQQAYYAESKRVSRTSPPNQTNKPSDPRQIDWITQLEKEF